MKISDETVEALGRALAKQAAFHGVPWHVRKAVLRDVVPYLEFDLAADVAAPAVPQPVDREAIAEALYMHDNRNPLVPTYWSRAMKLSRQQYLQRADAVLALLNSSQ